ncbi:MAG: TlpA family protein disulfide reductase [Bacteroidetes bacterium]|nr:TlpA family protein disulfide reductase [Bacteroidota bacterium]
MNRFTQWLTRFGALTLTLLLFNACNSNGQDQSKLDTPEWTAFRTLAVRYDSMTAAFEKMEKENPEFAKDPQKFLGDDLQKYYALVQSLGEKVPQDLGKMTDFTGYGYDDLRVVKLAAMVSQQMAPLKKINVELLKIVADADSIRNIKLETAQLSLLDGDLAAGEKYATDDVLSGAEPLQRGGILSSFSQSYYDGNQAERARSYAVRAVKAYGEASVKLAAEENDPARAKQQTQWILTRYASVIAPLMYDIKESGDAPQLDSFVAELKKQLPESTNWNDVQASVNDAMEEIAKDREALGKPAAAWAAHEWLGSKELSLDALKGKVVLIDFFATWCKPCIMAFPHMREWQEKYAEKGLVIVGLTTYQGRYDGSTVTPAEELKKLKDEFIPKQKVTWPVGVEKSGRQTMTDYKVQGIPHVVLIDRAGKVQYVKVGATDFDKTERKIQQLLAE